MPRIPRNNMNNSSFFHIMVQGINKEYIFNTFREKKKYIELIYKNIEGIEIIAYCIMDNHAHILIKATEIKCIEKWMKKTNTSYAIYYNKKLNRVGYVFRNRYKIQVIKNEKHLYLCVEYIHNNPVKANICDVKENYEFSSYISEYRASQKNVQEKIQKIIAETTCIEHSKNQDEDSRFNLLDIEKEDKLKKCQEIIRSFLEIRKINIESLKKDKKLFRELIYILKVENNISYRVMEKYFELSRETLRKLLINHNEG